MSSVIDICNRSLSEMGTQSTITSFDEGSVEGTQCGLWYDKLRRGLLRTANWGFSRGQTNLTQLGDLLPDNTSPYPWLGKYAWPSDCLKFRYTVTPPFPPLGAGQITPPQVGTSIVGPWLNPSRSCRFIVASDVDAQGNQIKVLLSNVQNAIGVYTRNITNPEIFDDLFELALTSALSFHLVVPLAGNVGMRESFAKAAQEAILQARVADGNEAITRSDPVVDWITARGAGSAWGTGLSGTYPELGSSWGSFYGSDENMSWGM